MTGDKFCDYCNMANGLHAVNCPNRAYFGARAHGGNALITEAAQLRAANAQLASQVTRYRSQIDVAQGDAARYRAALENIEAESFEMFAVTVAADALHPEPEGKAK